MSDLTHVELLWLEKRIENWIRFGHASEEQILDKRRRILSFAPGSIFAFVRWASNDFGTIISRIDILRAVAPGQRCVTVPYVRPGGEVLLRLSCWRRSRPNRSPSIYGTLPKARRSVSTSCSPTADLQSPGLLRSSRLNHWQHSSQIGAICRAAFAC